MGPSPYGPGGAIVAGETEGADFLAMGNIWEKGEMEEESLQEAEE